MVRVRYGDVVLTHPLASTGVVILPNAEITLYEDSTTNPLVQTIYQALTGIAVHTNPFLSDADGNFEFFLETPQYISIKIDGNDPEIGVVTYDHIAVGVSELTPGQDIVTNSIDNATSIDTATLTATGAIQGQSVLATGNVTAQQDLYVSRDAFITRNTDINGNIDVAGTGIINKTANIGAGIVSISGPSKVSAGGLRVSDGSAVSETYGHVQMIEGSPNPNHSVIIFETLYDAASLPYWPSSGPLVRNDGNRNTLFVGTYDRTFGKDNANAYFQWFQDSGFSAGRALIAAAVRKGTAQTPGWTGNPASDITWTSYTQGQGLRTLEIGNATQASIDDPIANVDQNISLYLAGQFYGQGPIGYGGRPSNTAVSVLGIDNFFNMWNWTGAASYPKGVNEIQRIQIIAGTNNYVRLNDGTGTCADFLRDEANPAVVKAAIGAASTIGVNNISVIGSTRDWYVYYQNLKAGQNVPQLQVDPASQVPAGQITITTITPGEDFGLQPKYYSVAEGGLSITPEGNRFVPLSVNRYPGFIGHGLYLPEGPFHARHMAGAETWTRPISGIQYLGMFIAEWDQADNNVLHFSARSQTNPERRLNWGYNHSSNIGVIQSWSNFPTVGGDLSLQPNGGHVGLGTGSISAMFQILPHDAATLNLMLQTRAGQTADILQMSDIASSIFMKVHSNGVFNFADRGFVTRIVTAPPTDADFQGLSYNGQTAFNTSNNRLYIRNGSSTVYPSVLLA